MTKEQHKIKLSEEQKRWWERLLSIYASQPQQDLYYLQLSLRQLVVEALGRSSEKDRIVVAGQTVMQFKDAAEKAQFINRLSRSGEFTDDAVLTKLLHTLGFQPVINMPIPGESKPFRMIPFEQATGDSLRIELVNNAYASSRRGDDPDSYRYKTGSHWSLKGHSTPGIENSCAFYAVAQRIQEVGLENIPVTLPKMNAKEKATVKSATTVMTKSLGALPVPAENKTVEEIEQEFKEREAVDQVRYELAREKLEKFSVPHLIEIYKYALTLTDGDTYLKNRPRVAKEEMGNDLLEKAIATGTYPDDFSFLVKEELVHMLAKEAWRNPKAYNALMQAGLTEQLAKPLSKTCREEERAEEPSAYRTPTLSR